MQLHGPAALGVHAAHLQQHGGLIGVGLGAGQGGAAQQLGKNGFQRLRAGESGKGRRQAMVGGAATQAVEHRVARVQRGDQRSDRSQSTHWPLHPAARYRSSRRSGRRWPARGRGGSWAPSRVHPVDARRRRRYGAPGCQPGRRWCRRRAPSCASAASGRRTRAVTIWALQASQMAGAVFSDRAS